MRNAVVVTLSMLVLFVLSGGWHYLVPGDDFVYGLFYRLDTAEAEKQAWIHWFLYTGPAGALFGLIASICFLLWKRRKAS